jgi:hypothetical protein
MRHSVLSGENDNSVVPALHAIVTVRASKNDLQCALKRWASTQAQNPTKLLAKRMCELLSAVLTPGSEPLCRVTLILNVERRIKGARKADH